MACKLPDSGTIVLLPEKAIGTPGSRGHFEGKAVGTLVGKMSIPIVEI